MEIVPGVLNRYACCRRAHLQHALNSQGIDAPVLSEDEQRWLRQRFLLIPVFSLEHRCHRSYHDFEIPPRPETVRPLLKAVSPGMP